MNDIERELRAAIERRVADITPSGSTIPARIVRLIRWRRTARVAVAGATVLALGVAAFMVPSAISRSESRQAAPETDAASSGHIAADAPLPPWMRRLTPPVELAAGVRDGTPWSLVAFKVAFTKGRFAGERAFCSNLGIGGGPPNALCQGPINNVLGSRTHVHPIPDWRQRTTAVHGFTSADVTDVTLQLENGTVVTPELGAVPTSLGPAGGFFVAFVDPAQDIDVIALDRTEARLQTVALEALPRLTVRKTGSGDGFVIGAETCPACPQPPPEPTVECGADCWAEFEEGGGSVTLEAKPSAGSRFAGWSGACVGIAPVCVVTADSDVEVTAQFEPSG
jgi:hypothetical protein